MNKKQKHFQKIEELKERYRNESLEVLQKRFGHLNVMYKEARIALREVIEEREQNIQDEIAGEKEISN